MRGVRGTGRRRWSAAGWPTASSTPSGRRYFQAQTELTRQIKNPEERSRASAGDRAEMRVYARWRDQAHPTRAQASTIMNRLHDLDVMITSSCSAPASPRSAATSWSCPGPSGTCTGTWSGFGSARRRSAPPSAGIDPNRVHTPKGREPIRKNTIHREMLNSPGRRQPVRRLSGRASVQGIFCRLAGSTTRGSASRSPPSGARLRSSSPG